MIQPDEPCPHVEPCGSCSDCCERDHDHGMKPVVLVVEELNRYWPSAHGKSVAVAALLSRIAREGRQP